MIRVSLLVGQDFMGDGAPGTYEGGFGRDNGAANMGGGFPGGAPAEGDPDLLLQQLAVRQLFETVLGELGRVAEISLRGLQGQEANGDVCTRMFCRISEVATQAGQVHAPRYLEFAEQVRSAAGLFNPSAGAGNHGAGAMCSFMQTKLRSIAPWGNSRQQVEDAALRREFLEHSEREWSKLMKAAEATRVPGYGGAPPMVEQGFQRQRYGADIQQDRRAAPPVPRNSCAKCHGAHHIRDCTVERALHRDGTVNLDWDYGFGPGVLPQGGQGWHGGGRGARGGGRGARGGGRGRGGGAPGPPQLEAGPDR